MGIDIKPTIKGMEQCIQVWKNNPKIHLQEQALSKLFLETYPKNEDIHEITIKVSALNTLYSTQLRQYTFPVIEHLNALNIDARLKQGDLTLVSDIVQTPLESGKIYRCYSFATKYCSFHRPDIFPIYDSYVNKILVYLQQRDGFAGEVSLDNRNYLAYTHAIAAFQKYYKLDGYNLKELDKYLWQLGYELRLQAA